MTLQIVIMRHGQSAANERRLYGGRTDFPLTAKGEQEALDSGVCPGVDLVYVSTLSRSQRTAELCFPNARQIVVDDLCEMHFGAFEGRSADDMADDPAYREWVDGWCTGRCPGGECWDEFSARIAGAVERIVAEALERGDERVIIVAHGGTIMASMNAFSDDGRDRFSWSVGNCGGYRADVALEGGRLRFVNEEKFSDLGFLGC